MPYKPAGPCKHIGCSALTTDRYCPVHAPLHPKYFRTPDFRPSSYKRGYDYDWRKIRANVLKAHGIPEADWPRYDVDHNPPYNPDIEPDHLKYQLTPRLHAEHSRKTARKDGGFGHRQA